ncbi:MAG: hypothetical protein HKN21_13875 [Candidatus Eisenbacteria bacterium]|uniref:DUF1326 domain-containing protein n=1 Tax=Eiseniibacteriota bacterium TaxID=2212470 RepID=A0A7Y2EBG7_UNCEI|nr:hypothetical protein [Candidatus Eisenbacteria bacterium]
MRVALSAIGLLILLQTPGFAEITAGIDSTKNYWSFSEESCGCEPCDQGCDDPPSSFDFSLVFIFHPLSELGLDTPYGVVPLGDSHIDSVKVAPSEGYVGGILSKFNERLEVGRLYVLKTADEGHALLKFTFLAEDPFGFNFYVFEFKYQDDGTGIFDKSVTTQGRTWGYIKQNLPKN